MVHYIRFLKPPFICQGKKHCRQVKALVTITTDLGDTFFAEDQILKAEVRLPESLEPIAYSCNYFWKPGDRVLWIEVDLPNGDHLKKPLEIRISPVRPRTSSTADFLSLDKSCTTIFSAWSNCVPVSEENPLRYRQERRLLLEPGNVLSIYEDCGESIARHIW